MYANEIKSYLLKHIKKIETNYVVKDEVSINNSVVDVLVVNGIIHSYEIKSSYDTVERLSSQLLSYKMFSHKVSLVLSQEFYLKYKNYINNIKDVYNNIEILLFEERCKKFNKILSSNVQNELTKSAYVSYWTSRELSIFLSGYTKGLSKQLRKYFLTLPYDIIKKSTLTMLKERYKNNVKKIEDSNYNKSLPKLKNFKYDEVKNNMSKYVPFIPMSSTACELLEIINNGSIAPYLGIRKFGDSDKAIEQLGKEKSNYLSTKIKQLVNKKKHFVDFYDDISYPDTAIKVFDVSNVADKSIVRVIIKDKKEEIGLKINPKNYKLLNIKETILDYLGTDKIYWIILNYNYQDNYNYEELMYIYNDIKALNLSAKFILLGSSINQQYSNYYETDKRVIIPNRFLLFFREIYFNINSEVYYGDYLGYEQKTSVGTGFSTNPFPRIILLDPNDPDAINYVRLSVDDKNTSKNDYSRLKFYIQDFCSTNHCKGCINLLEKDLWTNTTKRYCFLHNIQVMKDYFDNFDSMEFTDEL